MSLLITICARGGSKGIPGKNIRPVGKRPLIDYTIAIAKKFADLNNGVVTLSSDDEQIRAVAETCGLPSTYVRPEVLATDTAGKIDVIRDILLYEEQKRSTVFDYVLDLDVTSPLRTLDDLETSFTNIRKDENAVSLFSVNHAARNPYFNMVEAKADGYYQIVKRLEGTVLTRQNAPKVYDMNASFYFYRRAFFDMGLKSPITDNSLVHVMEHICFDLDHPVDFDFMEYLVDNNKLEIKLI